MQHGTKEELPPLQHEASIIGANGDVE